MPRQEAYAAMMADHARINGPNARLALGVGNDMSYAFYTDRSFALSYWPHGLPPYMTPTPQEYPLLTYTYRY